VTKAKWSLAGVSPRYFFHIQLYISQLSALAMTIRLLIQR